MQNAAPSSLPPLSPSADILQKTATPALFARAISDGKWKAARHLMHIDRALVDVANGRCKRLIIEAPPRHGKSELASKFFTAWYLGTFPDRRVILTSATDELAVGFSMEARDLLAEHGPELFRVGIRGDSRARHFWQTSAGGSCRSAGVGGSIIGKGANLLIVDDFFKNVEEALSETTRKGVDEWFMSTSKTRLTPDGAIIIIATRWHADDLIGRCLKEMANGGDQWRVIGLPAIAELGKVDDLGRRPGEPLWPEQFGLDWLNSTKASYVVRGYEWMWEALYQRNPPLTLDSEFSADYFGDWMWFDDWPQEKVLWKVMALDPSVGKTEKSDFSAFVKMALTSDMTMWVDADLQRRDPSKIVRDGVQLAKAFSPHMFSVEANGFQVVLQNTFWEECKRQGVMLNVCPFINTENKLQRIRGTLTEYLHQRRFRFKKRSPGASLLVEQLKSFPGGKHDDGPDALEMAVRTMTQLTNLGIESFKG